MLALKQNLREKEKSLRIARTKARDAIEKKHKSDAQGKKKHKGNIPPVAMNQLKNKAQKSTSKLKGIHTEKIQSISKEISELRKEISRIDEMKMNFDNSGLHTGKTLIKIREVNHSFDGQNIWLYPFSFDVKNGDRITIEGKNGAGKTTLIKLMLGHLTPRTGNVNRSNFKSVFIDQDYALIDNYLTIYEQAQKYNDGALPEHEIKIRLNRYLFEKESWSKSCDSLSGGEKMKLALCCLMINTRAPDIFALDEPTNNLDIHNIDILTAAVKAYKGTVIVVSHDLIFLKSVRINRKIEIKNQELRFSETYKL
jgi:ATPase subunit of ABC transporter with duplicated ATPase domains